MYLKRIELHGFKSFADKVNVEFQPGITGIVGPNGCGKSNISDAVRWVLGEQSVKSLRGANMSDVIFAGSEDRRAQNLAEVTLVFDNSDRFMKYDYNEVEITRRLYRMNNEAEYLINKQSCRLKDIIDLIMDTGLGKDSLSIISQGNISSFADNKPEERRGIFEDAAGVSKYKKRKLESIRKLERTNENLERIGDIVSNLANYYKLVYDEKGKFSNEAIDDLNKMYKLALEMVQDALDIYEHDNANKLLSSLNKKEHTLNALEIECRQNHLVRMRDGICEDNIAASIIIDIISSIERIGDIALNTANSLMILERCANLLVELAEAKEVYQSVTTDLKIKDCFVRVTTSKVNGVLGTKITTDEIKDIFSALKFEYTIDGEEFNVKVPTYRNDITLAADLIEEVARMYGYDKIPSTLPEMSMTVGKRTDVQAKKHLIRNLLKDQGLHETLTYSLTSPVMVDDFNIFHTNESVKLAMPLGEERSVTRKSIIGSLLQVINYNQSHNIKDVNIFELSTTYSKGVELQNLAIACCGEYNGLPFKQISYKADYYLVKGFVETIFKNLGIEESRYKLVRASQDDKYYHPGRTAYIMIGKEVVGVVGNIHPLMEKKYNVKDVYIVELNLTTLLNLKTSKVKFTEIPMYPSVSRDIALVMDQDIPTFDICRKIVQASKQLVKETKIFDVYAGEHIEAGKKSVAINLLFQDPKGTLEEATVNAAMEKILAAVEKDFGAVLRA